MTHVFSRIISINKKAYIYILYNGNGDGCLQIQVVIIYFKGATVLRLNHFENVDIRNQLDEALKPFKCNHFFLQKYSDCGTSVYVYIQHVQVSVVTMLSATTRGPEAAAVCHLTWG